MVVVRERDAGFQASLLLQASWSRALRGWGQRHLLSTSSPAWSLPRSIPSMCGSTQQRVPARTWPLSMLPAWAAVSNSFSSPVEPLALGKQNCQPAHLVSSAAPAALSFPTKALNVTSVQASWELPLQLGSIQGFNLSDSFWLALSVPFPTQIWVRPSLRSSSRPSVAMGMASTVPMLSLGTMCPWPPLVSGIW